MHYYPIIGLDVQLMMVMRIGVYVIDTMTKPSSPAIGSILALHCGIAHITTKFGMI
jgi:hypothetical protein